MVDNLRVLKHQRDEALVTASESLLGRTALDLLLDLVGGALALRGGKKIVASCSRYGSASGINERVGTLLGGLGGVGSRGDCNLSHV